MSRRKPMSCDEVNARIDRGRGFDDFVDTGMGAANHDHESFGGVDDEGEFAQFECTRLIGYEWNQMDVWCDFRVLVYELEIRAGPS